MKLKFYLIGLLTALVGFTACSDDSSMGIVAPDDTNPTGEGNVTVNVNLQKPASGSVSYADLIWIGYEATVDTLDAYVFAEKDGKYILERIIAHDTLKRVDTQEYMSVNINLSGIYNRRFYFVANGASIRSIWRGATPDSTTVTEFEDLLTDAGKQERISEDTKQRLLMTAQGSVTKDQYESAGKDNNYTINLSNDAAVLRRVAARLDIQNFERLLIIDSVRLSNTPNRSYIFPHGPQKVAPIDVNGATLTAWPVVDIRTHKAGEVGEKNYWELPTMNSEDPTKIDSVHIPSLYFPFESYSGDSKEYPVLRIWGRLGQGSDMTEHPTTTGAKVTYDIQLKTEGDSIARNHRYILRIKNALSTEIDYDFKVRAWEIEENDTIPAQVGAGTFKLTDINGAYLKSNTVQLAAGESSFTLMITSDTRWDWVYEGDEGANGSFSVEILDKDGAIVTDDKKDAVIGKYLKVTVGTNSGIAARGDVEGSEVWYKVYSVADPSQWYRFTFHQEAGQ